MQRKDNFSNKIYVYTFILCMLVIFIHAENMASDNISLEVLAESADAGLPLRLEWLFANVISQMAVPGFFLISGYLFYRFFKSFSEIIDKMKKRFFSLLIPFCAWNIIGYLLHVVSGHTTFSLYELSQSACTYTYNPTFWYLWQLILLVVLAPIFFVFLKHRISASFFWVLIAAIVFLRIDIPYINEDAILYYYTGALLGRYGRIFFETESVLMSSMHTIFFLLVTTLAAGLEAILIKEGGAENIGISVSGVMLGGTAGAIVFLTVIKRLSMALTLWFLLPSKHLKNAKGYMKINFFLYAVHYPLVRLIQKLTDMVVPLNDATMLARLFVFFITPLFIVMVAYKLSLFLKAYLNTEWQVLSGNR